MQRDGYALKCQRYIELNPVRANMVAQPAAYPWSSYAANAGLAPSRLVTPHGEYLALGRDTEERGRAYRELFRPEVDPAQLKEIRSALNGGFVLGDDRFKAQIAEMLKRRVERGAPGRPRKEKLAFPEAGLQRS